MNDFLSSTWTSINTDTLSTWELLWWVTAYIFFSKTYNALRRYILSKMYSYYINEKGGWEAATKCLNKSDEVLIMPPPSFTGLRGSDENYSSGFLELAHEWAWDGKLYGPKYVGVMLTPYQAQVMINGLETYLARNKEASQLVRPSQDGRVIDITNVFKAPS